VRVKALAIFAERTASPKEIAAALDLPISSASYHVRVLDDFGLIELREEQRVRGSLAHFYGLNAHSGIDADAIKTILTHFTSEE
jgi:DNA-binding transcriptional ArsR family regulator